jgi:hypothetical protein
MEISTEDVALPLLCFSRYDVARPLHVHSRAAGGAGTSFPSAPDSSQSNGTDYRQMRGCTVVTRGEGFRRSSSSFRICVAAPLRRGRRVICKQAAAFPSATEGGRYRKNETAVGLQR